LSRRRQQAQPTEHLQLRELRAVPAVMPMSARAVTPNSATTPAEARCHESFRD